MDENMLTPYLWSIDFASMRKLYVISDKEKTYTWGKREVGAFINDLFDSYINYHSNYDERLYLGRIGLHYEGKGQREVFSVYSVSDGVQRFTSLNLLLLALLSLARKRGFSFTNEEMKELRVCIWKNGNHVFYKDEHLLSFFGDGGEILNAFYDTAFEEAKKLPKFAEDYECLTPTEFNIKNAFLMLYDAVDKKTVYEGSFDDEIIELIKFTLTHVFFNATGIKE